MNKIQVITQNNQLLLSSVDVAKMIDKEHKELLRDIRTQIKYLNGGKIALVDFFVESQYEDKKGENRPCYLLTQKGCEYIANKLTGEKGALFTAKYINVFHEMKQKLLPSYQIEDPIKRAEKWIEEQKQYRQVVEELEYKDDVIIGLTKDVDLATKQQRINDIIRHAPVNKIRDRWRLLYKEFDRVYHIDSKTRHQNAIDRADIKKTVTRLSYICSNLNMTHELYRVCVKLYESDAREMFENILDLI